MIKLRNPIKDPTQKRAYEIFMLPTNINDFRLVFSISILYLLVYVIVDYTRSTDYLHDLIFRSLQILTVCIGLLLSYSKNLTTYRLNILSLLVAYTLCILAFAVYHFGGLPPYQLTNTLYLFLIVFNALMSYSLKAKFFQTILIFLSFSAYAIFYSQSKIFHSSQIVFMATMGLFTFIIALIFESYKQLNYLQLKELAESKGKIEDANNLKTRLISILSHDLVAPLFSLKGVLELSKDKLINEEEKASLMKASELNLTSTISLAKNLVMWSRAQLGRYTLDMSNKNITDIIHEVVQQMSPMASLKSVEIVVTSKDKIYADLDAEILRLSIRNLLTNAIKFSHNNSVVNIYMENSDGFTTFSVVDSGIGISSTELDKLFTLKKASGPGTQNEMGSGIGLFIIKEFIEKAGGIITAKSEPNKGSTFTICFPLR